MKIKKRTGIITGVVMFALFWVLLLILIHYKLDSLGRIQVMQVAMDIFSMSLGLILFIACMKDRDRMDSLKLRFLRLLTIVFFALFADAAVWTTGGHAEARILSIVLETLLYFCNPMTAFAYFDYVIEYLGVREKTAARVVWTGVRVGVLISFAMRIINLFYPVYFLFDEAGVYHRQSLYALSNAFTYICGILTLVLLLIYRKYMKSYQLVLLLSFVLAPLIALVVNALFFGLTPAFCAMTAVLTSLYLILNVEKTREHTAVEAELSMANRMQMAMLPNLFPEVTDTKEYDLFASMTPAREVGGDFYDCFMLDDRRLAFLVADVSDKGIGAALFMAVSKAMIKMRAQAGGSPAEVLSDVDKRLGKNNDLGMFVTVWLGYLDLPTGHVVACNAGHDYPALYLKADARSEAGGFFIEETAHGPAVAFLPGMVFPEIEFDMEPGDRIFLYTDGVNEAQGKDGEQFDLERLIAVLNAHRADSSEALCRHVKETVDAFVGDDPQFDDMTMLALTYRGGRQEASEGRL